MNNDIIYFTIKSLYKNAKFYKKLYINFYI